MKAWANKKNENKSEKRLIPLFQKGRKYWSAFLVRLKGISEYKLKLLSMIFKPIIRIIIISAVWWQIFQLTGKETIAGMDIFMFITYLSLTGFIKMAVYPWDIADEIVELIKTGNLLSIITKPINFLYYEFSSLMAEVSLGGFYGMLIFLGGSALGHYFNPVIYFPENALTIILFLFSVTLAVIMCYFFYFIVACSAFWCGESWSILGGITVIQAFLSGEIIPLNISPVFLMISNFMPFKFMMFVPAFIYLGKYSLNETLWQLGGQIVWLMILFLLARFVLKKGIQKFEAQGG